MRVRRAMPLCDADLLAAAAPDYIVEDGHYVACFLHQDKPKVSEVMMSAKATRRAEKVARTHGED